jgi:hypothetical protein
MLGSLSRVSVAAFLGCLIAGCGGTSDFEESTQQSQQENLTIEVNRKSVAFEYTTLDFFFPAGVAGGRDAVFVGSPFEGRVVALSRVQGKEIGELPPPASGFILPFILKQVGPQKIAVLDAGGFPSPLPLIPAEPTIYEYDYAISPTGVFSSHLSRTLSFASVEIGFSEDIVRLDDGRYLLADAALGAIWIGELDGTIVPGIVPKSLAAADQIPQMRFCDTMPEVQVGGLPFLFTDSTLPGVSPLAVRNGIVYFASPCGKGVYQFPLSILTDHRQPFQRAADIKSLSPQPSNVLVEELLDATFDQFNPDDPYLYAADAMQLRLIRIDTRNGKREVVADNPTLFNFPASVAFLPPLLPGLGVSEVAVVSNQQQRTPLTNDAVTTDTTQRPFITSKTLIFDPPGGRW